MKVRDLEKKKRLVFVSDEPEVQAIKEQFGKDAADFDSFFVEIKDGYFKQLYGIEGKIPNLDKTAYKIKKKRLEDVS